MNTRNNQQKVVNMVFLKVYSLFEWRASFDVTATTNHDTTTKPRVTTTKQYCLYPQRWWIVFSVGLLLFTRTFHFMSYPSVSKVLAPFYDKVKMRPNPRICWKVFFIKKIHFFSRMKWRLICSLQCPWFATWFPWLQWFLWGLFRLERAVQTHWFSFIRHEPGILKITS